MRNSHLYQYLKGLKKASGSQKDKVANVNLNYRKGKGQRVKLSAMSLLLAMGIFLPLGNENAHASTQTQTLKYVIQKGDTLYKISQKYKVSIANLKQANNLKNDNIVTGKKLVIPGQSSSQSNNIVTKSTNVVTKATNSNSIYNSKIPMKKEYQEYLYKLTQSRGLDYKKTLAIIRTESSFKANALGGNNYGLMQINKSNHDSLVKKLGTANKPYDVYVNLNWGTYLLADYYNYWKKKGYTGAKLDNYAWSSYNQGLNAVIKNGVKTSYVNKINSNLKTINNLF